MRGRLLMSFIAFAGSGCGPRAPSVRYTATLPVSVVSVSHDDPDAPCGYAELGSIDISCPTKTSHNGTIKGGCTFEDARDMATNRAAQADINGSIAKVRATRTADGRVVSMHAVAVQILPCAWAP